MMQIVYSTLVTGFFVAALPYYAVQMIRKAKYRAGLAERLGFHSSPAPPELAPGGERVWIHAVSVGETIAVMPLVKAIRQKLPGTGIVLSTVTATGQKVARERAGDGVEVVYFPLDMGFPVRRALDRYSPSLIVLVETELWPNFIAEAARRKIPLAIVNGRISDRSFPRYRLGRFFLKRLLAEFSAFHMQTALDAERIRALGAPPERVAVAGNMKFDCGVAPGGGDSDVRARLGIAADARVLVAGSTHRGEEELLLDAFRAIAENIPGAVAVIVPRHPDRGAEVASLAESHGERTALRSRIGEGGPPGRWSVLVVDTIGELASIYRAADAVFVGKSFTGGGGQNIIEPAAMGKPVVFGPSMYNFREASEILLRSGGARQVADAAELRDALLSLMRDRAAGAEMGRRASEAMALSRGATARNLELVKRLLAERRGRA